MATKIFMTMQRFSVVAAIAVAALPICSAAPDMDNVSLVLSGANEVPAVTTKASGSGNIVVAADKTVSGSVTTVGMVGTMAHIHAAPVGQSGPVVIALEKTAANQWSVPVGAKLDDAGYQAYKSGGLYVNVHSAAHPDGEIRGQLRALRAARASSENHTAGNVGY